MSNTIKLSLISAALLSQLNASEITLKPLEVTSTVIKTDELKSTHAVEVYTQKDIEAAHVQNIAEFLNTQTSVSAVPNYGNPFLPSLDMHGYGAANGNQNIVITINGRKLNNIDSVPQLLSSISPASISRIEIIKSSGIVLGGDGANAGVINITTKANDDKNVAFYIGSYGLVDGSFYVGHNDDKLSISVSGEAQKNDGIRDIDAAGNKDENKFSTATFNLAYTPIQELELRLGASATTMNVIYAGSLSKEDFNDNPKKPGSYSVSQAYDTKSLNAGISYFINDNITLTLDANTEDKTSAYLPSTTSSDYRYNSAVASIELDYDIFSLVAGIDAFYGDLDYDTSTTTKNNLAGFLMSKWYIGGTTLKAGYRYEKVTYKYDEVAKHLKQDNDLHGVELGFNYAFNQEHSLFVDYAHAYQAPNIDTFFQSDYSNWPSVSKGFNEFIDPMTSDNFTLGYNYIIPQNKLKISAYYVQLEDEIYYYSAGSFNPANKNTNIDKSYKYGFDLYDKYIINQEFNIMLNYNYVQAIIDEESENGDDYSGKKLPGVSDHSAKATFSYLPNKYATLSLTEVYRSEAYAANDFNNNFSQKQDAYYTTDISATYAKDNWEIFAKINNLFNQGNGVWIRDDAIYPVNFTTTGLAGFKLKY